MVAHAVRAVELIDVDVLDLELVENDPLVAILALTAGALDVRRQIRAILEISHCEWGRTTESMVKAQKQY